MRPGLWLLCLSVLVCACQKKTEAQAPAPAAAPAPVAKLPTPDPRAEVEFSGEWVRGGVESASVEFVAQLEPCTPVPAKATRLGTEKLKDEGRLFAEFYVPQGTVAHVCLYALDATGAVVGAASYEKNPVTLSGQGEVEVGPMKLTLSKL